MPLRSWLVLVLCNAVCLGAVAAGPPNQALIQQQTDALAKLQRFDGVWRGQATVTQPDGSKLDLIQTERVGPMLGGALRVIEGRGHAPDGSLVFNAFAVISFSPSSGKYNFRSHAQGYSGDFPLEVTEDGFSWSIQAGPAMLRYTASIKDGTWSEVGERIEPGKAPVRTFEMQLRKVGETEWPAGGAPAWR